MFFVILPILVIVLVTSTLFLINEPTWVAYSVTIGVDFLMVFSMVKAYLLYLKTSHQIRDKEFVEEITAMVKKVHDNRAEFTREEIVLQLENINRMINEYNIAHEDIIVEPVNIQDFLQHPTESPN